jgi:hypothetical protein
MGELYQSRDSGAYEGTYASTGAPIGGAEAPPDEFVYGDVSDSIGDYDYSLLGASLADQLDAGSLADQFAESTASDNYYGDDAPIVLGEGYANPEEQQKAAYAYGYEKGRVDALSGNPENPTGASGAVDDPEYRPIFEKGYVNGYGSVKSGAVVLAKPPAEVVNIPIPGIPGGSTTGGGNAPAAGMSTGTKVMLGLGAAAAVAGAYAYSKRKGRKS